jgi:ech hydrogenase subunit D
MNEAQTFPEVPVGALVAKAGEFRGQGWRLVQIGAAAIGETIEVTYSFDRESRLSNLRVTLAAEGTPRLPSIAAVYPCAFLYENEMHDLFRIQVDGMAVDFKGKFYRTTVPFPFAARGAPKPPSPFSTS